LWLIGGDAMLLIYSPMVASPVIAEERDTTVTTTGAEDLVRVTANNAGRRANQGQRPAAHRVSYGCRQGA
jgi:hypothetical protein